jgi:hypothetical protein
VGGDGGNLEGVPHLVPEKPGLGPGGMPPIRQSSFPADFGVTGSGEARELCGTFFRRGCLETHLHKDIEMVDGVRLQVGLDGRPLDHKGFFKVFKHKCFRAECPVCWEDWASRETRKASHRLQSFKLKGKNLRPIHLVVSVPHEDYGLNFDVLRRKSYKALKKVHVLGGMCIFHSKRWKNKNPYFSPHFHIIGFGWVADIRRNYIFSGYVVRNLGVRKTVEGTIWYQLSHAGICKGKHAVTWFGCLSYNKLRVEKEEKEEHLCPFCKSRLREVVWIGKGDCPLPMVEGFEAYGDAQGWVYADVLKRAGGGC